MKLNEANAHAMNLPTLTQVSNQVEPGHSDALMSAAAELEISSPIDVDMNSRGSGEAVPLMKAQSLRDQDGHRVQPIPPSQVRSSPCPSV